MLDVSVVVPTYNRRLLLRQCLRHVCAQTLAPCRFEIIVADDECSSETGAMVMQLSRHFPEHRIRYCAAGRRRGPAAARNEGWRRAYAGIIAFTDDDCQPAPAWLEAGLRGLNGQDAVWGKVLVPLPAQPTDYERNTAGLARGEFVTANCLCRRGALERVGGFDERFTRAWREDSDLYFTMLEKGMMLTYVPEAVVTHPARPAALFPSLAQQRNNVFEALLCKKHPKLYRQMAALPMIWYYVALLVLAAAALAAAAAGHREAALWAGAGWAAGTLLFAFHRLKETSRRWRDVADVVVTSVAIPPAAVFWRLAGHVMFRRV